ncbi:radial spoke head 1 homolog [Amyelois transitella]|uniref:radial spoke head 1 homolog n=1 Tax=Amyelois transitella TaxID=680683 RepID=UPI0029905B22|nr:radial spoke head 1 homolog [Amyelois transitella]
MSLEESETEVKKPVKEVPVVQDEGFFQHQTGDTYDGFFEAKKKDRSLKMCGPGVYITAEGDIYSGIWEGDKFGSEEASISYKDGSRYEGYIKDWSYSGKGKYFYPDNSVLSCDFVENCPVGNLVMTDPNGHTWLATAERGYGWFEPVNHYYDMLEKTRDYGGLKRRSKKKPELEKEIPPETGKKDTPVASSKKSKK